MTFRFFVTPFTEQFALWLKQFCPSFSISARRVSMRSSRTASRYAFMFDGETLIHSNINSLALVVFLASAPPHLQWR